MPPPSHHASAYANVGVETGVNGASPHRLILMLFEGARVAIANARGHMQRREIAAKGVAISKAIAIINEGLNAALDVTAGGVLAQRLRSLYEYMCNRLVQANLNNDPALLDEVARLLVELQQAWEMIGKEGAAAPARPAAAAAAAAQPAAAQPAAAPAAAPANRVAAAYGRV